MGRRRLSNLFGLLLLLLAGCTSVPYTQRSQLILLPEGQEVSMGVAAYKEILHKSVVVRDPAVVTAVQRVGERIARVADKPKYNWEFTVIDDDSMINAFALPGGKVAAYTGLLPIAEDEAGLAAVIGHEVAHVLARHGAERMSRGLLLQIGAIGVSAALGGANPYTRDAVLQAYGLGAQVGLLLPFSRAQEAEADRIGMILMAKAGYDPGATLALWRRMDEQARKKEKDATPPEFLSTHPSYGTRQANIRAWLPAARGYYQPDPSLTIAKLPPLEQLYPDDAGAGVLDRYVRAINSRAAGDLGERLVVEAMARVLRTSREAIVERYRGATLSLGEIAVASALAEAAERPFAEVAAAYRQGAKWPAVVEEDEAVIRDAVLVLREVLVEVRQLEREARHGRR